MKPLKLVVACGSGCCTSSICKNEINGIADSIDVPVEVITCSSAELENYYSTADILMTVMPFRFPEEIKHSLNVYPLITGMGSKECKEKILNMIKEIVDENSEKQP